MELDFYKLHICGNDFVLFNFLHTVSLPSEQSADISKHISKRGIGVGSNGVIFLSKDPDGSVLMQHFNYAGIEQMSYDACICTARFIFDYGLQGSSLLTFRTGNTAVSVESIDSRTFRITTGIPVINPEEKLRINEKLYTYTPVSFSSPGASFFFLTRERGEKKDIADTLNSESSGKQRIRTVFTSVYSNEEIKIEPFFKRGVRDIIFAAAVAGTASVANNYCDNEILINSKSGKLFFQWKGDKEKVYLTGKPEYVYRGTYYYDEPDN